MIQMCIRDRILDGDGCDRSHGGEGQTSTRLGAFLEMLGGAENE